MASKKIPVADRFWAKVDTSSGLDGCWEYNGYRSKTGLRYGQFWINGQTLLAHRVALMLSGVDLVEGLQVCHHCDNPPCCNPAHLYQGTAKENKQDCVRRNRQYRPPRPTHCLNGHEYTVENTIWQKGDNRMCRICENARNRQHYKNNREKEILRSKNYKLRKKESGL